MGILQLVAAIGFDGLTLGPDRVLCDFGRRDDRKNTQGVAGTSQGSLTISTGPAHLTRRKRGIPTILRE
jgi:hypothetical protein